MAVMASTLNAITVGYNVAFRKGLTSLQGTLQMPWVQEVTSTGSSETYPIRGRVARMREWVGERMVREHQVYGYTLRNKRFEDSLKVSRVDIEDDKYALYSSQAEDLGMAAARLPYDESVAALLVGNSSLCYDGQYFFDTDHPKNPFDAGAGTQANNFASLALSATNVSTGIASMRTLVDEFGTNLGVNPTHLIVPAGLEKTAKEITQSSIILQTSSTYAAAPSNVLQGSLQAMVVPELDAVSATTWYLADLGKPVKPLFWQWRIRPEFSAVTSNDSEYVMREDAYLWGARARGAAGYGLWQLAARFQSASF